MKQVKHFQLLKWFDREQQIIETFETCQFHNPIVVWCFGTARNYDISGKLQINEKFHRSGTFQSNIEDLKQISSSDFIDC